MKNRLNILSLASALLLTLMHVHAGETKSAARTNLLTNSGFEQSSPDTNLPAAWDAPRGMLSSDIRASQGNTCARISLTDKPTWGPTLVRGYCGQNLDLAPGTYVFSAMIKAENLDHFKLNVRLADIHGKRTDLSRIFSKTSATFDWREFRMTFTIPGGMHAIRVNLQFLGPRGRTCTAWVDQASLLRHATTANLVFNSSFEIQTTPGCPDRWFSDVAKLLDRKHYDVRLVSDTSHSGKYCVMLKYDAPYITNLAKRMFIRTGYCQDVAEGKTYTISLYLKTDTPGTRLNLWVNYVNRKVLTLDSTEWKRYSFTTVWRRPYRKARFAFIILYFAGREGKRLKSRVWVDDLQAEPGTSLSPWTASTLDSLWLASGKHKASPVSRSPAAVQTASIPHVVAARAKTLIKIDGTMAEPAWLAGSTAQCETPFKDVPANSPTACRISFDDRALYIGIKAEHHRGLQPPKPDEAQNVFQGDWVEIFLDPNDQDETYYQLIINQAGAMATVKGKFDPLAFEVTGARGFSLDTTWQPVLRHAVKRSNNLWTAEIRIPLNLFGGEIGAGNTFRANFCRVNSYTREANCWARMRHGFHEIRGFGVVDNLVLQQPLNLPRVSPLIFIPCLDQPGMICRFSVQGQVARVEAELLRAGNGSRTCEPRQDNGVYSFLIPPQWKANGRTIRVTCQPPRTDAEPVQAFGKVTEIPLLAFGVDSLTFCDEKAFTCSACTRLPQAMRRKCTIEIAVNRRGADVAAAKHTFPLRQARELLKVPLTGLVNGWYVLHATLLANGRVLARAQRWTYLGDRRADYTRTRARNRFVEKSGKPFMMRSPWGCTLAREIDYSHLREYAEFGYNTVVDQLAAYQYNYEQMDHEAFFRAAKEAGLYVIADLTALLKYHRKRYQYSREKTFAVIRDFVLKFRNHPNLLMYHGMDEWWAGRSQGRAFCSEKDIEEVYWFVRELDPYHPLVCNLGPRPKAWSDLRHTDIFSYDCYVRSLTPTSTNLERFLSVLDDGTRYARDSGKPMFNVLQLDNGTELAQTRLMRPVEQKALVYSALLGGVKGFWYFTGLCWCDPVNRSLARIHAEVKTLEPFLLDPDATGPLPASARLVIAKWYSRAGKDYIIAVNANSTATRAALRLPPRLTAKDKRFANPVFEGKSIAVEQNTLKLKLAPYQRVVFMLGKSATKP